MLHVYLEVFSLRDYNMFCSGFISIQMDMVNVCFQRLLGDAFFVFRNREILFFISVPSDAFQFQEVFSLFKLGHLAAREKRKRKNCGGGGYGEKRRGRQGNQQTKQPYVT